jgi:hypothetical protein
MKSIKAINKQVSEKTPATNDNEQHDGAHTSATPQQSKLTKKQRKSLLQCCAELAESENILVQFDEAISTNGLAGESRNAKIIFLAMITRLFERPVSVVVKGSSSGGKNTLASGVLKFIPPEAFYEMTGMSEKALAYFSEPLKNRVLVITEAAGLQGNDGLVFLRCLLSEGTLKYVVTVGKRAKTVEIEGPTGVIITTTDLKLYHDDETRLFSIEIADTPDQNRKVFDLIAEQEETGVRAMGKPGPEWHALMTWIASKPRLVVNPYARSIASLVPENAPPRLRRDLKAVFGLVSAHALLHQKTRKKRADGAIIATLADYKAVRALVKDVVAEGTDAAVPSGVRRAVQAVAKLLKKASYVSGTGLAAKLNLHTSTVSRGVVPALEAGYLRNLQEGKRTAQYVLGEPMPADTDVLPTAKAVLREFRKRTGKKAR